MVVGIDVDGSGCYKYEGGVDVDGELDVSVLVPVELELGFFLVVVEGLIVFFLLVLHLLLDDLIDLAHPLQTTHEFGL